MKKEKVSYSHPPAGTFTAVYPVIAGVDMGEEGDKSGEGKGFETQRSSLFISSLLRQAAILPAIGEIAID
ncbi:hypothetical protein CFE70_007136 [Pyrenophora teres f. teres 0-1]|uniref:Uncharacterized protein n=1 Tax=Pyrenophora teres f. teres (strain 0-1) TaxID=861557 RepID=E3RCM6_PYRTT|nr:hypothetical protein PTT_00691 [Pyrenophora teres f. teres 0-1]